MNRMIFIFIIITIGPYLSCIQEETRNRQPIKKEILLILDNQVQSWNQFDIEGYMAGYWISDSLRFASGKSISYGWQNTLNGYKSRYNTPEAIGHLDFSDIDITILSDDAALVFGRYQLKRKGDALSGLFTLIFRKKKEGWRIVADHTSGE